MLDIGSGYGLFSSKLSRLFNEVVSLEPDKDSIKEAKSFYKEAKNITYINDDFLSYDFGDEKYDSIVEIASIHHMDFTQALRKIMSLLDNGGKLVILGLYKEATFIDYLYSIVAFLPNLILNIIATNKKDTSKSVMITRRPELKMKDIYSLSNKITQGYTIKRHLFWRYSLVLEKSNE